MEENVLKASPTICLYRPRHIHNRDKLTLVHPEPHTLRVQLRSSWSKSSLYGCTLVWAVFWNWRSMKTSSRRECNYRHVCVTLKHSLILQLSRPWKWRGKSELHMAPLTFSIVLYGRSWILTCCLQSSRSSSSLRENDAARRTLTQWQKRGTWIILLELHSPETREIVKGFRSDGSIPRANGMETKPTVIKPDQCEWRCVYQLPESWLQEGSSYHTWLAIFRFRASYSFHPPPCVACR